MRIPVIFHNLRGCDSPFTMQNIGKLVEEKNKLNWTSFQIIWRNIMAFTLNNNLVFLDSFQFMSSSLVKLVDNLITCRQYQIRKTKVQERWKIQTYETQRCLFLWQQGQLWKIWRNTAATKRRILLTVNSDWWAHNRWRIWTCSKCLKDIKIENYGWISQFVSAKWCIVVGWCVWKFQKDMFCNYINFRFEQN